MAQPYFYRRTEKKNIYERNFIKLFHIEEGNRQFLFKHTILQFRTTWTKPIHTLNDFGLVVKKKDSGNAASWKTNLTLEIQYIYLGHTNQEFKLWWFKRYILIFSSEKSSTYYLHRTCCTCNAFNSLVLSGKYISFISL